MIKELYRMAVFAKVVECGSFSGASNALGLGKSVVSQHVQALERSLGVRLLNRSTRSISLTDEGRRFLDPCQRIALEVEAAFQDLESQRKSPRGTLRLTAPFNVGQRLLIPMLHRFRQANPLVQLDVNLEDSVTNVIAEGFDLAIRVGWLTDSRLHAVSLARMEMVVCASPEYLSRAGAPSTPEALAGHPWVAISVMPQTVTLAREGVEAQSASVRLKPSVLVNSGLAACEFVLAGSGLGLLPDYAVRDDIASGRLLRVLPEWATRDGTIAAVFAHQQSMPPKLRALIDFLKLEFSGAGAVRSPERRMGRSIA